MAYLPEFTIDELLRGIQDRKYVLPAIQREFVWSRDQICRLFDSLMREYPIGSLLFWRVDPENVGRYTFYEFMRDYHQKDRPYCEKADLPDDREVIAILDGQQRLTSLNIGLRGEHAQKLPRLWWNNPDAFPSARLYLNLNAAAPENDLGIEYDFRFFVDPSESSPQAHWFPVASIRDRRYSDVDDIYDYVDEHGLTEYGKRPFRTLARLWRVVHKERFIKAFQEEDQDIDRVLDIFIRTNSGGEVLTKSDLLLSIATAQWTELDARQEIRSLQTELNEKLGSHFDISKDLILKAGLMMTRKGDIAFRVKNFTRESMGELESAWGEVSGALRVAVGLFARFGLNASRLTANSPLIPVAFYAYQRGLDQGYLDGVAHKADRERIRRWVLRSLLKQGVWGAGLDTTLRTARDVLEEHGQERFPYTELLSAFAGLGRGLELSDEELDALVETPYQSSRVFALLSLLYPHVPTAGVEAHHVDHIFPRAAFHRASLRKLGLAEAEIDELQRRRDLLPNLQLLEGPENISKQAVLPAEWLDNHMAGPARANYADLHDLGELPDDLTGFQAFYDARAGRLRDKLEELLDQ